MECSPDLGLARFGYRDVSGAGGVHITPIRLPELLADPQHPLEAMSCNAGKLALFLRPCPPHRRRLGISSGSSWHAAQFPQLSYLL